MDFKISCENSKVGLKCISDETIDMVMTSPPYDNLRTYGDFDSWNFETFQEIAKELVRVIKPGGVIVWVVADATIDGSETGTSFRQALHFMELGLNLHDTMIYQKKNYMPINQKRYEPSFEYMFCFSKGSPKAFNPIKTKCNCAGMEPFGEVHMFNSDGTKHNRHSAKVIKEEKVLPNIFSYRTGSIVHDETFGKFQHPAVFPYELARDQIKSWTNAGDTVLDPFMGSGTSGIACAELGREFLGI